MSARSWVIVAAISGAMSVVMGAFAAHGIDTHFSKLYAEHEDRTIAGLTVPASYKYTQDFRTAATYQMWHSLALLGVASWLRAAPSRWLNVGAWMLLFGIVTFSGSLYVLTLTTVTTWGAVAPIGGLSLILGWLCIAVAAVRAPGSSDVTPVVNTVTEP